jgi:hypothetical protein
VSSQLSLWIDGLWSWFYSVSQRSAWRCSFCHF